MNSPFSPEIVDRPRRQTQFFEYKMLEFDLCMALKEFKAIAISEHVAKIFNSTNKSEETSSYCPDCRDRFIIFFRQRHTCSLCIEDFCSK